MSFMVSPQSQRSRLQSLYLLLAVLLPLFCTWLTSRYLVLHQVPYSLHLIVVLVLGFFGGLGPSLIAVLAAFLSRVCLHYFDPAQVGPLRFELLRCVVLAASAMVIWMLMRGRRRSELKLESTLAALQERTDDLVASLASSKCACWTFDLESGVSPRWYGGSYPIFGRPFAELEAMPSILTLVHPDDHPRLPGLIEHLRNSTDPVQFEYRCHWPNGELHSLEMRGNRIPGKVCAWRGVTVDITERKLAEAALLRAEKLAAMGRLASTVAHEINNPLESVTNLLYLASAEDHLPEPARTYLATAETELARLSNITRLTLGFVRTSGRVGDTSIATIVDEVLSIFEHRVAAKHITIQRHYAHNVNVHIAPHELRQIATNLIANAIDAVSTNEACISVHLCNEDEKAMLLIDDNGTGIEPEHLARIFEPFFSTKEEVGTGIGLWVTRELVEKNGGRISVESRNDPAHGKLPTGVMTRFRVEFPLAPPQVSAQVS
jgi:PAS domain S-box-containing protein